MNIKESVNDKTFDMKRELVLETLTRNLGRVAEEEDKIICYVDKTRDITNRYITEIWCYGIREENKHLANKYNLNKRICYIFDGLDFPKTGFRILGYGNCDVIIRNCSFTRNFDFWVNIEGNCTIENCYFEVTNFTSISANNLIIKNINVQNHYESFVSNLSIFLSAKNKLEINDSYIGRRKEKININLFAPFMESYNSIFAGNIVSCESKRMIVGKKSAIKASDKVKLKVDEFSSINVSSPFIDCNDKEIRTNDEMVVLTMKKDELSKKRIELLELLKKIKDKCEKTNGLRLEEYKSNSEKQSIYRVLKK